MPLTMRHAVKHSNKAVPANGARKSQARSQALRSRSLAEEHVTRLDTRPTRYCPPGPREPFVRISAPLTHINWLHTGHNADMASWCGGERRLRLAPDELRLRPPVLLQALAQRLDHAPHVRQLRFLRA